MNDACTCKFHGDGSRMNSACSYCFNWQERAATAIMLDLQDRRLLNGVDADLLPEIRDSILDIIESHDCGSMT